MVARRKFGPEATLELVDGYRETGLTVVPVMFDRIMEMPADVRDDTQFDGHTANYEPQSRVGGA